MRCSRSIVLLVSARDMPAVGSSSSSSFGSCTRHIASSSRRLSPRDRLPASMSRLSARPTSSSMCSARSRTSCLAVGALPGVDARRRRRAARSAGIMTFSSRVSSPKISGVWNTRATPAWLISCGCRPISERPSKVTEPLSGDEAADEAVEQRRLAGAVGADDGVHAAFLDREVDVVERAQPGEALVDALDVKDRHRRQPSVPPPAALRMARRVRGASRLPCGAARRAPRPRRTGRQSRRTPSITPPGRKITSTMNSTPSVSCQPSPTNRPVTATIGFSIAVGQEAEERRAASAR